MHLRTKRPSKLCGGRIASIWIALMGSPHLQEWKTLAHSTRREEGAARLFHSMIAYYDLILAAANPKHPLPLDRGGMEQRGTALGVQVSGDRRPVRLPRFASGGGATQVAPSAEACGPAIACHGSCSDTGPGDGSRRAQGIDERGLVLVLIHLPICGRTARNRTGTSDA